MSHTRPSSLLDPEVDKTAADPAYCRNVELAGTDGLPERLVEQQLGALEGSGCIVDLQPERANGGAVRDVEGMGKTFLFGVDDEVDAALMPPRYGFGFVPAGTAKAERREHLFELGSARIVDGKLHEFGSEQPSIAAEAR